MENMHECINCKEKKPTNKLEYMITLYDVMDEK